MIDVCGNDRPAASNFLPNELWCDLTRDVCAEWFAGMREAEIVAAGFARAVRSAGVSAPGYRASEIFANRDEFHLGRDDAASRIPKLGDRMIGGCAQWFAARGRAGSIEC